MASRKEGVGRPMRNLLAKSECCAELGRSPSDGESAYFPGAKPSPASSGKQPAA